MHDERTLSSAPHPPLRGTFSPLTRGEGSRGSLLADAQLREEQNQPAVLFASSQKRLAKLLHILLRLRRGDREAFFGLIRHAAPLFLEANTADEGAADVSAIDGHFARRDQPVRTFLIRLEFVRHNAAGAEDG